MVVAYPRRVRRLLVCLVLGFLAGVAWERRQAGPRLRTLLDPRPGERLLAVGPGADALATARRVAPGGTLELVHDRRPALDHALQRAAAAGVDNVVATLADPRSMPFADASFDGAFVVDADDCVVRELHRVVRSGGRVVVPGQLVEPAVAQGFRLDRRSGSPLGYVARLARL
jgi:SAM-dependent methyltransferase